MYYFCKINSIRFNEYFSNRLSMILITLYRDLTLTFFCNGSCNYSTKIELPWQYSIKSMSMLAMQWHNLYQFLLYALPGTDTKAWPGPVCLPWQHWTARMVQLPLQQTKIWLQNLICLQDQRDKHQTNI